MCELRSTDEGSIVYTHTMMNFVFFPDPAKDRYCFRDRGLVHNYLCKATLQCGVLFDIFSVLSQSRGADTPEFSAGKERFEQVCFKDKRVNTAVTASSSKH